MWFTLDSRFGTFTSVPKGAHVLQFPVLTHRPLAHAWPCTMIRRDTLLKTTLIHPDDVMTYRMDTYRIERFKPKNLGYRLMVIDPRMWELMQSQREIYYGGVP
jgi:hypothetical protein